MGRNENRWPFLICPSRTKGSVWIFRPVTSVAIRTYLYNRDPELSSLLQQFFTSLQICYFRVKKDDIGSLTSEGKEVPVAGGTWLLLPPYFVKGALRSVTACTTAKGGRDWGAGISHLGTWTLINSVLLSSPTGSSNDCQSGQGKSFSAD